MSMRKQFGENVQKLFDKIVTRQEGTVKCSASDLLDALNRKATKPLRTSDADGARRLVYDNVTLDIREDMSSMGIAYIGNNATVIDNLQKCDAFQLSEFVMALECDIPKWKHLWVADDKLRKEKNKIKESIKAEYRRIKQCYLASNQYQPFNHDSNRMRFYNIKAKEFLLENDNPYWENKKTESEILDAFNTYHIVPPIEKWFEEWNALMEECEKSKEIQERQREEFQHKVLKKRHLAHLKQMKIEALIRSIDLHPALSVKVNNCIDARRHPLAFGFYNISVTIDGAKVDFIVRYRCVDDSAPVLVEYLKRINELVPELRNTLYDDGYVYFLGSHVNYYHGMDEDPLSPYFVAHAGVDGLVFDNDAIPSIRIVKKLNRLVKDLKYNLSRIETENEQKEKEKAA